MEYEILIREISRDEEQLIAGLATGARDSEVASYLGVSMPEYRNRMTAILGDLHLPDRDSLVAWREAHGPSPLTVAIRRPKPRRFLRAKVGLLAIGAAGAALLLVAYGGPTV
ncbi:MAG: hypothetical protein KC479_05645 [Dehalococcoidia bacterium]|nr:hypothetical protein [Dehalococcoidia bacterium]MCA9824890.1 hypothetical protein [Dehalococcoidia bacterium]MCA9843613.1 hypothetical protein [Dehalococcoidia bacterium]